MNEHYQGVTLTLFDFHHDEALNLLFRKLREKRLLESKCFYKWLSERMNFLHSIPSITQSMHAFIPIEFSHDLEVIEKFMMKLMENFPRNFRAIIGSIPNLRKYLHNSVDFVLKLANINIIILKYTSKKVLESEKLIEWALEKKHTAIRYIEKETWIRKQKYMKKLVGIQGHYLEFASEKLKSDPDFVMIAIKQDPDAMMHVSKSLTNNIEFLERVRKELNNYIPLNFAPEEWRDDKAMVMNVVSKVGMQLQYASNRLRNDPEVVNVANIGAFKYASDELKSSKEFLLKYWPALIYENNFKLPSFITRENIIEKAKEWSISLRDLPQYADDKEVVQAIVVKNGHEFEWCSNNLKDDQQTLEIAMLENPFAFNYASLRLQSNREFNTQVLMNTYPNILHSMPQEFKTDKSFLLPFMKKDHEIMKYVDNSLKKDKDFVIQACRENPLCSLFIDEDLKQDTDFCVKLLNMNGLCLRGLITKAMQKEWNSIMDYFSAAIIQNGFVNEFMLDHFTKLEKLRHEKIYGNIFIPPRFPKVHK